MKPRYIGLAVMTVDGKIARNDSHYVDWSSREDKKFLRTELDASDAIIIGRKTFATLKAHAKKNLPARPYIILTHSVKLTKEHNGVLYCNADNVNLDHIMRSYKYKRVAVLGGAHVYDVMLRRGWLNEFYITIEPMAFGKGISLLSDNSVKRSWKLTSLRRLNRTGTV